MWDDGSLSIYDIDTKNIIEIEYSVKHYPERGGHCGINDGKISILQMRVYNNIVVDYNKGWILPPDKKNKAVMNAYNQLLAKFN